jgi:hypothetical protein
MEQVLHSTGGDPALVAYRAARTVVGTAQNLVKAGVDEYPQAISDWKQAVDEFHKGNYRNAATSAAQAGTDAFGIVTPTAAPLARDSRRLVESTRPGGDFAGEFSRQAVPAAAAVLLTPETVGDESLAGAGLRKVNPFRAKIAASEAAAPEVATGSVETPGYVKQVIRGEKVAQPQAQAALRTGAETVSGEPSPASLRTSLEKPISDTYASAKNLYRQVDEASGTDFKALNDKLDNTEYQLSLSPDGSPEEAKWEQSRTNLMNQIADAKQKALDAGVDPDTLKQADAKFTQARALQDLQQKVFKNPNIISGNAAKGTPETINVDAAVKTLQKMQDTTKYGAPRLEQVLGKEPADALLKSLYDAQRTGVKALSRQQLWASIGKNAAKVAGVGGALSGIEWLKHLFD